MDTSLLPSRRWTRPEPSGSSSRLRQLLDVNLALTAYGDTDRLLDVIVQTATAVADCEAASILLHDDRVGALRFAAASGAAADALVGRMVPIEGSLAGTIFSEDRVVYASDCRSDSRHCHEVDAETGFETRALLGVPMRLEGRPVGVLEVLNPNRARFERADAEALLVVAAQAAVAIRNARHEAALVRLNEKLAEVDRLKSNFLAIASHELRTPLTSVRGFGQILAEEVREELGPYAEAVVRAGYRMTDVVETLDVMASLQGELGQHPGRVVDLGVLLAEAVGAVDREVRVDVPEGVLVEGHGPRLRLVLNNLIKNAVQFSPSATPVYVHGAVSCQGVHLRVIDAGRGIAADDLERIFEAYVQVEDPDHRDHEGLGVGLTVARAITAQHGGQLWAESDGPGRGATFHLTLPLAG